MLNLAQTPRSYTIIVLLGLVFFAPFFADFFLYFTNNEKEYVLQPPMPTQYLAINDETGKPTQFKKGLWQLIYVALDCTPDCQVHLLQLEEFKSQYDKANQTISLGFITSIQSIENLKKDFKEKHPHISLFSIDPLALKHFLKNANLKYAENTGRFWLISPNNDLMRQYPKKIVTLDIIKNDLHVLAEKE